MDIWQATDDKARLNPPNQLCFTVLATLPLYIAYRSPYIFARSTCVHAVAAYIRAHDISLRSCGCAHFRPGYVHGCVKRKHRGNRYRHGTACPCFMVSLIPFREVDLYESARQEFYPRYGVPRGLLSANAIVLLHDGFLCDDNSKHTRK